MKLNRKYLWAIFLIGMIILIPNVYAASLSNNYALCHDPNILKGMRILAYVIAIIKILVSIIIIITGMYSFFKALLDDKGDIKDVTFLLIKKVIIGVVIFFIPTIFNSLFKVVNGFDKTNNKYTECGKCLTSVKQCNQLINKYK